MSTAILIHWSKTQSHVRFDTQDLPQIRHLGSCRQTLCMASVRALFEADIQKNTLTFASLRSPHIHFSFITDLTLLLWVTDWVQWRAQQEVDLQAQQSRELWVTRLKVCEWESPGDQLMDAAWSHHVPLFVYMCPSSIDVAVYVQINIPQS